MRAVVDRLAAAAGGRGDLEDYCHAVEHSIEFQVVFLQHRYGPGVRIVPVLCGPFCDGPRDGRRPRPTSGSNASSARWASSPRARGAADVRARRRLRPRGPPLRGHPPARAYEGALAEVQAGTARVTRIAAGDAEGFWDLVNERGDDD